MADEAGEVISDPSPEASHMIKLNRVPLAFPFWDSPFAEYDKTKAYFHMVDSFHYGRPAGSTGVSTVAEHHATDLMAPRGTIIVAPVDGEVIANYWDHYGGWALETLSYLPSSGLRVKLYFAHMAVPSFVPVGTHVAVGDVLGLVGNTGGAATSREWDRSAGDTHLHLALYHETSKGSGSFASMKNAYHQLLQLTKPYYSESYRGKFPPHRGMPQIRAQTALEDIRAYQDDPEFLRVITPQAIRRWTEAITTLATHHQPIRSFS